jgi:hypothetical protein
MKNLITLFVLLATATVAHSQAFKANYTYDASGNRLTATVIWLQTTLKSELLTVDEVLTIQTATVSDTNTVPQKGYVHPTIDSMAGTNITIYPNPTHGVLLVQLTGIDEAVLKKGSIMVYGINGQKLLQLIPLYSLNNVNLSTQPTGSYILTIQLGIETKTYSIIKE